MPEEGQSIRVGGCGIVNQVQQDAKPEWFYYTAPELRNCIERLLFEYLVLFGREELTKQQEREYRPTRLKDYIISIEPDFESRLEFLGVMHQALGGRGVYMNDLDQLSEL